MTLQRLQAQSKSRSNLYPKSARLRKSHEFRLRPSRRLQTTHFTFVYCWQGSGRLGVSLSKKIIRLSVGRNRVRRLLRESFRLSQEKFAGLDVHVIGGPMLTSDWRRLGLLDIEQEFSYFLERIGA